jgi:hypothetical protein
MTMPLPKPLTWKTRNLRRLIKSAIWGTSMGFLGWMFGFQPTWQLLVLVLAAMFIDNILDAGWPSSSDDEAHAKALVAAEQAGYDRAVHEMKLRAYKTGKPA